MDKLQALTPVQIKLNQVQALIGERINAEQALSEVPTEKIDTNGNPWPSQFLRERILSIPEVKQKIQASGIENEAAMDFDTLLKFISLGNIVINILSRDHIANMKNLEEVGQEIQFLWGNKILDDVIHFQNGALSKGKPSSSCSYTEIRQGAIEKIKKATIANPEEFTFKLERAYRDLWVLAISNDSILPKKREENKQLQLLAIKVLGILDGMYQRDDIGRCSLKTDKNSYHGWQYNRKNLRTIDIDLGDEKSWYGISSPLLLVSKIASDILIDEFLHESSGNRMTFAGWIEGTLRGIKGLPLGVDEEVREYHRKVLSMISDNAKNRGIQSNGIKGSLYEKHFKKLLEKATARSKKSLEKLLKEHRQLKP